MNERHQHQELLRDKRSESQLACPTWNDGCHWEHMTDKPHSTEYGLPWCAECQTAHLNPHPLPEMPV